MINSFSIAVKLLTSASSANILLNQFSILVDLKDSYVKNNILCSSFSIQLGEGKPSSILILRK